MRKGYLFAGNLTVLSERQERLTLSISILNFLVKQRIRKR